MIGLRSCIHQILINACDRLGVARSCSGSLAPFGFEKSVGFGKLSTQLLQ